MSWTDAFNLNLGWLLSLGCLTQIDFYQKLLSTTLGPFVVAAGLLCTHTVVRHKNKVQAVTEYSSQRMTQPARTARLEKAFAKHYLVFLAMTFLIYSTVSATVFQTFACDTIDDFASQKTSYLRADYSIQCGTSKHTLYKIYASFMVIIYPLGVPALYAWLLWCNRDKLRTATTDSSVHMLSRHKDASLRSTRFLWKSYTARMYYWEVVECMRRLLLTGAVVFIAPGTSAQAAIACILAVVSMVTAVYFRPHADTLDGTIYLVGAMIIFLSMFLSLAMKVDISSETHYNQDAFGIVLLLLNVVMIVTALVQMYLVAHRAYSSAQQKNSMYGTRNVDSHAADDLEATVDTRDSNDTGVTDEQHQQQPAVHSEVSNPHPYNTFYNAVRMHFYASNLHPYNTSYDAIRVLSPLQRAVVAVVLCLYLPIEMNSIAHSHQVVDVLVAACSASYTARCKKAIANRHIQDMLSKQQMVLTAPTSYDAEIKALRSDIELMHKHTEELAIVKQQLAQIADANNQLLAYLLPKREAAAAEQRSDYAVAKAPDTWTEHRNQVDLVDQAAARSGKLELLQWMHKCGCRFEPDVVICAAVERDYVDVVAWLCEQFATSFAADFKQGLLWRAGWLDNLSVAQCLREHGAEWPEAFCCNANLTTFQPLGDHSAGCWSLQCVQWAIANGCTWGQWRCHDYNVTLYTCCCPGGDHEGLTGSKLCDRWQAAATFEWAQENGCPCTCEAVGSV
eukprot:5174-Heterococcus_DN1.PRE.7